jgi:dipeptidyl aminopeptidase/acylaminoacyl peptidase
MKPNPRSGAIALLIFSAASLPAQEPPGPERREGELQAFINPEAKDLDTRLELLQQTLWELDRRLVNLTFAQRYADRIRMDRVMFPNAENDLCPGWVFTPVKMEKGRRYPALVFVHGGYHYSLDDEYFGYIERALGEGYVAIFPEYRGSRGYGAEHYNAQAYGRADVADVLSAADYLAGRPYVDPQRMAIVGRSRGGMITLLAIQRAPQRFKCAVTVVGLVDFVAYMSYKPDYRREDVARTFGGPVFKKLPDYMDVSPLSHVDKIQTPLLIHATTADRTVPVGLHAERLIDALKARGKTFEHKIYEQAPGGHGYADGDTEAARDSIDRIFAFLARHLRP